MIALRRTILMAKKQPGIAESQRGMTLASDGLFSMLPERRPPWKEFVFSMGTQSFALLLLAWVGIIHPEVLTPPIHDYHFIRLVNTPPTVNHEPAPVRLVQPHVVAHLETLSPKALRVPAEIRPKVRENPPAPPKVEIASISPLRLPPVVPVIPRQAVKTNVFSTGSSAPPTIALAPQQVQTGGFGDPNGVPARDDNNKPVTIAQKGSFDLPSGPGYGNGTGGERGVRGVVASAGFGNGVAMSDNSFRSSRGVRPSGFSDAEPIAKTPVQPRAATAAPRQVPAEIMSKPTPAYTDEARRLHIEGEVLLEVVFESSGKLRVLRVVQGLGHGLDDAAINAAQQIRFKPATRDGQPADSTAMLHILFQLA